MKVQCMGASRLWIDLSTSGLTKGQAKEIVDWHKTLDEIPPRRKYYYRIVMDSCPEDTEASHESPV